MSLPRYPEYKDSAVEWLGEVPSAWKVDRLKASITSCKNGIWGDEPQGDESDIDCVRVADFDRARLVVDGPVPTQRSVTASERAGRILRRGDLLLEKSGGGEKQPVGQVVLYDRDEPAVCSNFVAKVSLAEGMFPRFWMYQHAAAYSRGVNIVAIKQTSGIQNLDQAQYFEERGVFPSRAEQEQIATFLDRETARIDALIAEQEKLLALLAEKRQATISHAVTRGLDPNAPMKDSGIAWLGEVPAHWSVSRFKASIASAKNGVWGGDAMGDANDIPCVRVADFDRRELTAGKDVPTLRNVTESERQGRLLKNGDLLLEKSGGGESQPVGQVVLYVGEAPAVCSNFVARVELMPGMDSRYWRFVHAAAYASRINVRSIKQTSGIQNLDQGQYFDEPAPFPPPDEQVLIADFLDQRTLLFDVLEDKVRKAIQLLQERRSALISAAVTGQIDVRGLVEMEAA